eukprot:GCRY01000058.1.p2 GENE.GCRY01000058.1~~GCRY01000058.1.p2  ORF type:complete len:133 (-),score=18.39 GCRY01000058.1:44-442(-)
MRAKRLFKIGKVCLVNYGEHTGNLVAILDIVDQNRALVAGPKVARGVLNLKRMVPTDLDVNIARGCRNVTLNKAWESDKVDEKFSATQWGKTLTQRQTRSNLSDFERFKVMIIKKKRNAILKKNVAQLKKSA